MKKIKNIGPLFGILVLGAVYMLFAAVFCTLMMTTKYFSVSNENMAILIQCCIVTIVIPIAIVVYLCLGLKREEKRTTPVKVFLGLIIFVSIVGALGGCLTFGVSGGVCSKTIDVADYGVFDASVTSLVEEEPFLFPEAIPEGVQRVSYSYLFAPSLYNNIEITLSYRYTDSTEFTDELVRTLESYSFVKKDTIGDWVIKYSVDDEEKDIFFAYNEKEMSMFYGCFYDEMQKEKEEYLSMCELSLGTS